MLFILSLLTLFTVQDTTEYDYLSEKGYDYLSEKNYLRNINGNLRYRIDIDVVDKGLYIYDHRDGVLYSKYDSTVTVLDSLDRMYIDETILYFDHTKNRLLFIDEGGGRVFDYNLQNKELNRLDKSYRFRSFYGSRLFYGGNDKIYDYGGAGEFSIRHRLIMFNHMSNQEWLDEQITGPTFSNKIRTLFLDLVSQSFKLFVLSPDLNHLEIYSARLPVTEQDRSVWTLENKYLIEKTTGLASKENYFSNKNLINDKLNILGNYFYDLRLKELHKWEIEDIKYGIFKSANEDSLIVVNTPVVPNGDPVLHNPFNFTLTTFHIDDFFNSQSFETIPSIRQQRTKFAVVFFALLTVLLAGVLLYRKQLAKISNTITPESPFDLRIFDNHILVNYNNENYYFYEEIEIKTFKVLNEILLQGVDFIELDSFDEKVFNGIGHKSHITTKRNKIFQQINDKLGFEFIKKVKSQEDKRRRFIKISI
jgi:hypothetical protein